MDFEISRQGEAFCVEGLTDLLQKSGKLLEQFRGDPLTQSLLCAAFRKGKEHELAFTERLLDGRNNLGDFGKHV